MMNINNNIYDIIKSLKRMYRSIQKYEKIHSVVL